jgi:hypothetical protein
MMQAELNAGGPAQCAPEPAAAGAFLDDWVSMAGASHITLVGIVPDEGRPEGRSFPWPDKREEALRWIGAKNAHANVYFSVNTSRSIHKKPLKADIETLIATHVDVDPR